MKTLLKFILLISSFCIIFLLGYYNSRHSKEIIHTSDTLKIYDTIPHNIDHSTIHLDTILYPDTILIPSKIDTQKILKDYYSVHQYSREFKDTNIVVNLLDDITKNNIYNKQFTYKILKPTEIIHNVYSYKTTHWSLGPSLEYGLISSGQFKYSIGISLQYSIIKF